MDKIEYIKTWWDSKSKEDQKVIKILVAGFTVLGIIVGAVIL